MKATVVIFLIVMPTSLLFIHSVAQQIGVDYDPFPDDDSDNDEDETATSTTVSPEESSWWATESPEAVAATVSVPGNGTHPGSTAVIGGSAVHPANRYPFMVSLQTLTGIHICGGTLIGRKTILTAAHCVVSNGQPTSPDSIRAGVGLHALSRKLTKNMFPVQRIAVHPDYTATNVVNDIAVVILSRNVPASIRPARLPATIKNNPRPLVTWLKATGWGLTRNDDRTSAPPILQEADFKVMPQTMCMERLGAVVTSKQICVFNDRVATCSGDSGGPLFEEIDSEKSVVFGIVSFGLQKGCRSAGNANVFTRISHYLPWIQTFNKPGTGF